MKNMDGSEPPEVCKYYLRMQCYFGSRCHYDHPEVTTKQFQSAWNKYNPDNQHGKQWCAKIEPDIDAWGCWENTSKRTCDGKLTQSYEERDKTDVANKSSASSAGQEPSNSHPKRQKQQHESPWDETLTDEEIEEEIRVALGKSMLARRDERDCARQANYWKKQYFDLDKMLLAQATAR